ncbi:hypothetical protein ABIA14_004427 [Sinorhizobium fredii]
MTATSGGVSPNAYDRGPAIESETDERNHDDDPGATTLVDLVRSPVGG